MTRSRVYISGPLTGSGTELENVARAIAAARRLIDLGFAPLCPHLSYHADPAGEIPHAVWLEVDLAWVEMADAVLRLPGESPGSDLEVDRAAAAGIPVFKSIGELVAATRHGRCPGDGRPKQGVANLPPPIDDRGKARDKAAKLAEVLSWVKTPNNCSGKLPILPATESHLNPLTAMKRRC